MTHFVLETDEGDLLLSASDVRKLSIKDMRTTITRTVTSIERKKRLTFRFEEPNVKRELLIVYFRPGVRWIPTYRVNLAKGETAEKIASIDLQAKIINEAEDLVDTPLDIVVGVSNFRFRTVASPLSLEQMLQNALNQAAPQLMGQFRNDFSNALYSQRSSERRHASIDSSGVQGSGSVDLPNELTAVGKQDLFVYNLPRITLRKGERAAVPIFSTEVPYRDVYTWDVHVLRDDISLAPSGSGVQSPLSLSQNQV